MDLKHVLSVLEEIEAFNQDYDAALAITAEQGRFMHCMIRAMKPARILELGTSTGYSAIWLASAAAEYGGVVETIEWDKKKIKMAAENFRKARLEHAIVQHEADINEVIASAAQGIGFVFMDSDKVEYIKQFKILLPKLVQGGVVSADNVVDLPDKTREYVDFVKNLDTVISETVPIGNGMEITVKL